MANAELCGTYQDLLYRRARALADYENSNKALDKARLKSKDIPQAEEHQKHCLQKFDKLSESGKRGLYIHLCVSLYLLSMSPLESTAQSCVFFFLLANVFSVELTAFKARRVVAFRKNLIEMAELEIKHAKVGRLSFPCLTWYQLAVGYIMISQVSFSQL